MTTQKRTASTVVASAVIGVAIVAVIAFATMAFGGLADGGSGGGASVSTHDVVDAVGRTVSVPDDPQSIAAADSFSGNVCVLIGAGDQMMGAPGGVISNELLKDIYPDLESLAQLSGNSINVETMLSEGVDVVFVKSDLYNGGEGTGALDEVGIPYVVVDYDTVEDQIEAIELVGEVCGGDAAVKAAEIADYYRDTVALVEERAAAVPDDERVRVYHSINDPLLTDGTGSLGADWIARTGAIDVSAEEASATESGDYSATIEQVYVWDPDVIICNTASACASIKESAQWAGIPAVSSGQVFNLPVSTSRWGQRGDPETFFAMLWLGKTVYPAYYEDIDLKETVIAYYRDIIGIEIDDETWDAIVAGEGLRVDGSGGSEGAGSGSGSAGGQ